MIYKLKKLFQAKSSIYWDKELKEWCLITTKKPIWEKFNDNKIDLETEENLYYETI